MYIPLFSDPFPFPFPFLFVSSLLSLFEDRLHLPYRIIHAFRLEWTRSDRGIVTIPRPLEL